MFLLKSICLFLVVSLVNAKMPRKKSASQYFNLCRRNEAELGKCIEKSMIVAKPLLVAGIPDLRLPSLDPMFITKMEMSEGTSNFNFSLALTDVTMVGLKSMDLSAFSIDLHDPSDVTLKFTLKAPYLHYHGKYVMGGRLLLIPVQGDGDFFMNFTSVTSLAKTKGRILKKEGKDYLEMDSMNWDISIKGGKCHFTNLFNNQKTLAAATNRLLNDNFVDLFQSLRYLPEKTFGVLFKDYMNIIFRNFPLDELMLP